MGFQRFVRNTRQLFFNKQKVGILGELARYPEALVFMRDQMRKNNSAALRQLYNHILLEAAQAERQRDPYVLYGIVYDNGKTTKKHWITC